MSSSKVFSVILILSFCSLVSTSGHLRLELTSSNDFSIRLITDYTEETIQLIIGEKSTSSFHPLSSQDKIRIGLSSPGGSPTFYNFYLRNTGQTLRQIFEESEIVVLVQATYECNQGFYGIRCQFKGTPTSLESTSTTTTTTTTTTVTTTTETEKTATPPQLSTTVKSSSYALVMSFEDHSRIIIVVLLIIIITLSSLIIVFAILLIRRQERIIFADTTTEFGMDIEGSAEKKYKILEASKLEEPRYVLAPFNTVFGKKLEF